MDDASRLPRDPKSPLPLVSVIFLTYNHERYVEEALEGLLSQTYPRLDIVIADDASLDSTVELIAARLASHAARSDIRFVRNERNLGGLGRGNFLNALALTSGEFVVTACGDDVMSPDMIEKMVNVWRREGVSLVTANAVYVDEHSKEGRTVRDPNGPYDESFETLARDGGNVTCFGAAMGFERRLFEEFGWPPGYLSASDIMLPFYAYLSNGARFIPEPLLKYRVHSENTSLSLESEAADKIGRLIVEEQIFYVHMAHAFFMEAELDRLAAADPPRFAGVAERIKPLVMVQAIEMGRKLVRTRIALNDLGIPRISAAANGDNKVAASSPVARVTTRSWPARAAEKFRHVCATLGR
jgi:glycosyltransferase involved in cell wall biosynthesis